MKPTRNEFRIQWAWQGPICHSEWDFVNRSQTLYPEANFSFWPSVTANSQRKTTARMKGMTVDLGLCHLSVLHFEILGIHIHFLTVDLYSAHDRGYENAFLPSLRVMIDNENELILGRYLLCVEVMWNSFIHHMGLLILTMIHLVKELVTRIAEINIFCTKN